MHDRGRAPRRYQPTVLGPREGGEGALDLAGVAHVDRGRNSTPNDGDTDWRAPHSPILRFMAGSQTTTTRVTLRRNLLEQLQPFCADAVVI
jgi:hypothetical protein